LELLSIAPNIVQDLEDEVKSIKSSDGAAGKVVAISTGLAQVAQTLSGAISPPAP
jgi:hypothetical protein